MIINLEGRRGSVRGDRIYFDAGSNRKISMDRLKTYRFNYGAFIVVPVEEVAIFNNTLKSVYINQFSIVLL